MSMLFKLIVQAYPHGMMASPVQENVSITGDAENEGLDNEMHFQLDKLLKQLKEQINEHTGNGKGPV